MRTFARLASSTLALVLFSGCLAADGQETIPGLDAMDEAAPNRVPAWPALADATIRPGVPLEVAASYDAVGSLGPVLGPGCTSNFLFLDAGTGRLLLGTAAHCAQSDENALVSSDSYCTKTSLPLDTPVHIDGASEPGRLVYSSILAMQALREGRDDACAANDFALVELAEADQGKAHPAMLGYGGPTGLFAGSATGQAVLTYGSSLYRPGPHDLDTSAGVVKETRNGGWTHITTFERPRINGDSGSPVVANDGKALGLLGTLNASGNNGVIDLPKALDYAREATGMDLRLMTWDLA